MRKKSDIKASTIEILKLEQEKKLELQKLILEFSEKRKIEEKIFSEELSKCKTQFIDYVV